MKHIPKNIIYLGWVSFFTDLASVIVSILIPFFLVLILKKSLATLGIVLAIATFVSYFFRILFGFISDRFQIFKPLVTLGYVVSAIAKPLFFFSHSAVSVGTLRATERMGKAIRSAPKDMIISTYVPHKKHGTIFGFHKMMDIAGELSGAILVGLVFYFIGQNESVFRNLFAFTAIPGILGITVMVFGVKDVPKKRNKPTKYNLNSKDIQSLSILVFYFLFLLFLINDSYYLIYAKRIGFSLGIIPTFIIILTLTQTLLSFIVGKSIDKFSSELILSFAFLAGVLATLFLKYNLYLSFIFLGIFIVSSLNSLRAFISKNTDHKASVFGFLYGGSAVFSALGALLMGFLWENYGFNTVFLVSLIGSISTLLLYVTVHFKKFLPL